MASIGWLPLLVFLPTLLPPSIASDFLTPTQSMSDGETLVSSLGTFELGFFSPGKSKSRYLGIWYKHIPVQTVVWVANRDRPITGASGMLKFGDPGSLIIIDGTGNIVWSTHVSGATNLVLQLLDSGNLVLRDQSDDHEKNIVWQSFDHPTDTTLPGMKQSSRFKLGITPWKSADDPSIGDYSGKLDPAGVPQLLVRYRSSIRYRYGPWNGIQLNGLPRMKSDDKHTFIFISNENESYYKHEFKDDSIITRLVIDNSGATRRFIWTNRTSSWTVVTALPKDQCDRYGSCGAYGVCRMEDSPVCECIKGFEPKMQEDWELNFWSEGCLRKRELDCRTDGFFKMTKMKLPDTARSAVNRSMSLDECRHMCLRNCSCVAFASANISEGGSGCVIWVDNLMDLRQFTLYGQDLYIRLAAHDLGNSNDGHLNDSSAKRKLLRIIAIVVSLICLFLLSSICLVWRKKLYGMVEKSPTEHPLLLNLGDPSMNTGLSQFSYATIAAATGNFSTINKLGNGGFGPVYKGILTEGQEVAVKRLSKSSGQGQEEFRNEIMLIGKLQHRNLVRLVGFCIQRQEKILVYEYMQNKSLDLVLFKKGNGSSLDWAKRMHIIRGIAQGLLYLHKYSRLRIIHRDLKAGNILLDAEWNPKISDFGMARIFEGNQNQENTRRIMGTYGYMPPEYALQGFFSEKSDVFSFGVLLLEIVSGKKNAGFHRINDSWNLLGYAWNLWQDERALELMDPLLGDSCLTEELLRCINVGLLCVQESPKDRPTMETVVSLLSSDNASIPSPMEPAFTIRKSQVVLNLDSQEEDVHPSNELTTSSLEAR